MTSGIVFKTLVTLTNSHHRAPVACKSKHAKLCGKRLGSLLLFRTKPACKSCRLHSRHYQGLKRDKQCNAHLCSLLCRLAGLLLGSHSLCQECASHCFCCGAACHCCVCRLCQGCGDACDRPPWRTSFFVNFRGGLPLTCELGLHFPLQCTECSATCTVAARNCCTTGAYATAFAWALVSREGFSITA